MTPSGIIIRAAILLCFFQLPLLDVSPIFSYFDELLTVGFGLCFLSKTARKNKIEIEDLLLCGCLLLVIFVGLFCNFTSGVFQDTAAIFQDIMTFSKVFVCYLGAKYFFCDCDDCWDVLAWASNVAGFIVVAGVSCLVLAHAGVLDMLSRSTRMGIPCFEFIYGSPGMLSQYCVLLTTVLTANLSRGAAGRGRWIVWVLSLILWASSLRTRAFVMIILIPFLVFFVFRPNAQVAFHGHTMLKRLTSPLVFVPVIGITLLVSFEQVDHYFGGTDTARYVLLDGGINAFQEFFPFGAGFATYGTEAARVYYSPLYAQYGISSHWALGTDGTELTDTFWPAIMAELGFIGAVLYVIVVFIMLRRIVKCCVSQRYLLAAAVSFVAYVLIASTATGVFFSYTTSCCMLFIGLIMSCASHVSIENDPNQKGPC